MVYSLVDTPQSHTAVNASSKRFVRTHIVGNVNDSDKECLIEATKRTRVGGEGPNVMIL